MSAGDRRHCKRDHPRGPSWASGLEGLGRRGDPPRRGRRQPLGRHPPAPVPAARGVGHRHLPQGRVDAPDRVAQAPAGPLAVPVRPVQRLDRRGHHGRRGVVRVDRGLRGVLRPDARPAVHRGDAGLHQPREDRADRAQGGACHLVDDAGEGVRRGRAAGRRARRPLPGPVHLRRAGHRLARQQQHRRVDLQPDGAGAAPRARVDRGGGGDRRHQRDDRPLRPLPPLPHAAVRRRPGELVLLPGAGSGDPSASPAGGSRIEGIGRPRVEPVFVPGSSTG